MTVNNRNPATPCPRCGETRFHVRYTVPVYAVVEEGRVVRVVVADESIDPTPSDADCAGCGASSDVEPAAAGALAVAGPAAWPAWEVGW